MSDDVAPLPARARPLLWLLIGTGVLALPVGIFAAVLAIYHHTVRPPPDTPATRRLNEIGQALHRYAQTHEGTYPPSLAALARAQDLPSDITTVPTSTPGGPFEYHYLGQGLTEPTTTNGTVLAYEPVEANAGRGSNLLFADGSQVWAKAEDLKDELDHGKPPGPPPE